MTTQTHTIKERPPVVVVMGHIDHGKSTLLDYIRKANVTATEAGGITQHISAYEVVHKDEHGVLKKITFLDTPGHEAFSNMRERGATTADIAILVVSAEDGVKQQTLEALNTILEAKLPYIVAINKIDRPAANVEKVKIELAEKGVYLEGYGGTIPSVPVSAKTGEGIPDLLTMILLVAELEQLTGTPHIPAEGFVLESHLDPKRGISATLIIKNGSINKGDFIVTGKAWATTRMLEDFTGKIITDATFSSPIRITGFTELPEAGQIFTTVNSKKEAEAQSSNNTKEVKTSDEISGDKKRVPLIIKADTAGTIEALEREIKKLEQETIGVKIISRGVGSITESDIKTALTDEQAIILGFHVKSDVRATEMNRDRGITVETFDIIYKLTEWLAEELEKRRPRQQILEVTGSAKVLKTFSKTKDRQVIGARIQSGVLRDNGKIRILRRDFEIGQGAIVGIERNKLKVKEIEEGAECGILVESKFDIAPGDMLEVFTYVTK